MKLQNQIGFKNNFWYTVFVKDYNKTVAFPDSMSQNEITTVLKSL